MANPVQDIIIAVMGATGSGKSTFVQHFTQQKVRIGSDLTAVTERVEAYQCSLPGIPSFFLLDTPGFNDSDRSDTEVLSMIAHFLAESYEQGHELTGIVHLHSIMNVRFSGSSLRAMRMMQRMCGKNNLSSIALTTTFWDVLDTDRAQQIEAELISRDKFWARLIAQGCTTFRQDLGRDSAIKIVSSLIDQRKERMVLQIQSEIVEEGKNIQETAAAAELSTDLLALKQQQEAEIERIRSGYQQAFAKRDEEHKAQLAKLKRDHDLVIESLLRSIAKLSKGEGGDISSGRRYGASEISGQAKAVLGDDQRTYTQTFHINNATFVYGAEDSQRALKRSRFTMSENDPG